MKVVFERDSVCAGDDVLAPNSLEFSFEQPLFLSELLSQTVVEKYLPSVHGAKTYWSAICDGEKVAEVEHSGFPTSRAIIRLLRPNSAQQIEKVFLRYEKQESISRWKRLFVRNAAS